MKKLLVLLAFGVVGCATDPAYLTSERSVTSELAAECADCVTEAVAVVGQAKSGSSALSAEENWRLTEAKKLYEKALENKLADDSGNYTGKVRVYRWGSNDEAPLNRYGWNADAGERWHVVRETCPGADRESCGREGVRPIDDFYTADDMTVTVIEPSADFGGAQFGLALTLN